MTFDEYMEDASQFALYPKEGGKTELMYLALGLTGEAGEVAEKIKKFYRDGSLDRDALSKELGDVLWYLSQLSKTIDYNFGFIANQNLTKLYDRQKRNVLKGNGDNR